MLCIPITQLTPKSKDTQEKAVAQLDYFLNYNIHLSYLQYGC